MAGLEQAVEQQPLETSPSCVASTSEGRKNAGDMMDTAPVGHTQDAASNAVDEALAACAPSITVSAETPVDLCHDISDTTTASPSLDFMALGPQAVERGASTQTPARPARKYMYIHLQTPMGTCYRLRLRDGDTLLRIKVKVHAKTEIPITQQHLLFGNAEMKDDGRTAKEFGLSEGSTITLVPRLHAGPLHSTAPPAMPPTTKDAQIMDALALHMASDEMQQLLADGKPMHLVVHVNGKYVVVRLNNNSSKADPDAEGGDLSVGVDVDECAAGGEGDDESRALEEEQGEKVKQEENERMASTVSAVRERLAAMRAARGQRTGTAAGVLPSAIAAPAAEVAGKSLHGIIKSPSNSLGSTRQRSGTSPRCGMCSAKLGMVSYPCKCANFYCSAHRPAHLHTCTYDYRT